MSHRKIPHPYYEQTGTPSSSNHPGAAEDVDAAGGPSSTIASFFDHVKFEAKKIKKGGRRNIFLEKFQARAGEKLLKASRCFLSTETGSVAGLLFISTEKIAFCSQRSITFDFPILHEATEQFEIPLRNIRGSNFGDPHQKIIRIRTEGNSEFLFIDFLRYEKARQNFETAMRKLLRDTPDELKKLKGSKSRDMVDFLKSGWTLLLTNLILEMASAVFDQLGYALVGMVLAFVALVLSTAELFHMARKERMNLLPIFLRPSTTTLAPGKPVGTIVEYFGLVGAVWQCVYSTAEYAYARQKKDNPIKMSLLPFIFLLCVVISKLNEK